MAASRKAAVVLKTVKKIAIRFSPFESNVKSTREFLSIVGSEKVRSTNSNCEVVPIVVHDKAEPVVEVTYIDGEQLVMKGANLSSREMLKAFQSRCIAKDPQAQTGTRK